MKEKAIDIIFENSVELPKAAKTDYPVVSTNYDIKGIKTQSDSGIIDVEVELCITTIYKAIDHTVRWNEQVVKINGSGMWDEYCKESVFSVHCPCVKKIKDSIKSPNIYTYQIYLSVIVSREEDLQLKDTCENNKAMKNRKRGFGRRSLIEQISRIHRQQINRNKLV